MTTQTIEYDNIILGLSDSISSETNKYLDKKANKSKFGNPTIKTQVNNFFKTNSDIITGAETAAKAADNNALSVTKRKKNITEAIKVYLQSVINQTTVETKYLALNSPSGSAAVPLPTVSSGTPVVTALATATPVTAAGTPIVTAAITTTTTGAPYEIILDTDKMKFFVYNLFAHDLAHDLFPSGTGLKRVVEIKNDATNPTRKTWINSDLAYGGGQTYSNKDYAEKIMFLDDVVKTNDQEIKEQETKENETKEQEIEQYNEEIKEFKPYEKEVELTDKVDYSVLTETYLLDKKKELSELIETDKTEKKDKTEAENIKEKENIKEIENEIEKAKTGIIINKTREFSIDVVKSAGITLEQKGMLWINKNKSRLKRENITDKLFLIIDVDTIMDDFIGIPKETTADLNEIYLKNPMYPGYIYFDNYVIHPYDITVTKSINTSKTDTSFTLTFDTINSDGKKSEHKIAFSPYLDEFDIIFDETNVFRKLCYYDQRCEINFKDAYNSVVTDSKDVNAYEFFSSIFNNYINVEISDDMDSYFYFLYPKFLLKHRKVETLEKFNKLFNSIESGNVEKPIKEYIENYKKPFECFQSKICKYLQKKQNEFLSKYEYKDEDNDTEFLFPKNIQNCGNENFYLFILSKMFAQMIVTENKVEIFEKIIKIVQTYESTLPKFNPVADETNPEEIVEDPEYISFLKLVLLNYPTVSKQIKNQSGGGVNDNYSKNAARIISTSVASIMYYLDKVIVPTNNILNTEINICQNIVTKQQASNIDDKLFDDFYTWTTMTKYAGDLKYYNNNVASSLPSVSFEKKAKAITSKNTSSPATGTEPAYSSDTIVGLPSEDFWGWLGINKPDKENKKLFFINNAASAPNKLPSERLKKSYLLNWFTKERIKVHDPDDEKSEFVKSEVDAMIEAIIGVSGNGTPKERADLALKTKYESYDSTPEPENKFWFCPFSSIIDGQPTCRKFFNRGDIKEKGTLYVTVRNLKSTTTPGGGVDPNEMIYTIKVEPKSGFSNDLSGEHKVLVHVLLKIGGVKIIDYGTLDSKGVAAAATAAATGATTMTDSQLPSDPAIEMDLDSPTSYLDAKECMIRLIDLSIGLLKNHSDIIRPWGQLITKLKSDNTVTSSSVAVKMPFKLHTPGTVSTYTNASYTSDQLRQKILRTSVIKSLGDYSQELNIVTKKSGYIDEPKTVPRFKDNKKAAAEKEDSTSKTSIRKPEDIRLGLSCDRPSGVRLVLLKLFGKEKAGNQAMSGTNPRSIVGYYDTLSKAMIAYDKSQFPPASGAPAYSSTDEALAAGYSGGKKIIRKSRKRNKGLTKKRKILLKNRKVSKRNKRGTRKRK